MNDKNGMSNVLETIRNSQITRIILLGFLIILLQIPIGMIRSVVSERQTTRDEAVKEVTAKWGKQQSIIGPMVTVPYLKKSQEKETNGTIKVRTEVMYANFLPDNLQTVGKVNCEERIAEFLRFRSFLLFLTSPDVSFALIFRNGV